MVDKLNPSILVQTDQGPQIVEADVANITQNGLLLLGIDSEQGTTIVAGFTPGSWRTFKKLDGPIVLQ